MISRDLPTVSRAHLPIWRDGIFDRGAVLRAPRAHELGDEQRPNDRARHDHSHADQREGSAVEASACGAEVRDVFARADVATGAACTGDELVGHGGNVAARWGGGECE